MPATTFAAALQSHLESKARLSRRERTLLGFLTEAPRNKRAQARHELQLARYEERVRDNLGQPVGKIDWSAIDWAKIIDFILKVLPLILAIL